MKLQIYEDESYYVCHDGRELHHMEFLKEDAHAQIQRDIGILNRQIRSIQTEGHFEDINENENFRRFNYRTFEKVYKEFLLYAIGRNINKYHRFLHGEIQKFEEKDSIEKSV